MLSQLKTKMYHRMVEKDPRVQAYYEGYVDDHKDFHRQHRFISWKYLRSLKKYFKNGENGPLPPAPIPSSAKDLGIPLSKPTAPPAGKPAAPKAPPAPKAAPASKPAAAAKRPPAPAPKKAPAPAGPPQLVPAAKASQPIPLQESMVSPPKWSPEELADLLAENDIVSFDIFDTLILRATERPTDIFLLLGLQLGIPNFRSIRNNAQKEACEQSLKPNLEVNIFDIYEVLSRQYSIDKKAAIEKEFQLELDVCCANPFMKKVFDLLMERGATVVATTDMYWPREYILRLLEHCGYTGFARVFVSCEELCNKRDGQLQQYVHKAMGRLDTMVHIGDNFQNDFKNSLECGIKALHYTRPGFLGKDLRPNGMSTFCGSFYKGLVNNYLHCGLYRPSPHFEHGYLHCGILVCGMCEWLNRLAKQEGIDKFLFVARDGEIFHEIYQKYYNEVESDYILFSRYASQQLVFEDFTEEIIQNLVRGRAAISDPSQRLTIQEALIETDMAVLFPYLKKFKLHAEDILSLDNYERLRELIYEHKDEVTAYYHTTRAAAKKYLEPLARGKKKVCVIDLGWKGTAIQYLKHLFEKKYALHTQVVGALFGTLSNEYVNPLIDAGIIFPFSFSYNHNQNLLMNASVHPLKNKATLMTEAALTSAEPTLLKYDFDLEGNVRFLFGSVNSNSRHVYEMHEGIREFARQYRRATEKFGKLCAISPTDAYLPMRASLHDVGYQHALFGDYVEAVNTLAGFINSERYTTMEKMLLQMNILKYTNTK